MVKSTKFILVVLANSLPRKKTQKEATCAFDMYKMLEHNTHIQELWIIRKKIITLRNDETDTHL